MHKVPAYLLVLYICFYPAALRGPVAEPRKRRPKGSPISSQNTELIRAFLTLVILFLLLARNPVHAQTLYGSIVGVVTDASGAVVPDATVKATQTETNEARTLATNSTGFFILSTIPPGTHVISISKLGFAVFDARDINVTINTTVRIDARLMVTAQSPETTTVSTTTAELQADRADVRGVVTSEDLQQLPQPTRTYEGLIGLLPGTSPPNPGFAGAGGTNNPARSMIIRANGTSANGTNVTIDGVSATNAWVQFCSTAVPSTEAIETVDVVTASSSADQGAVNGAGMRVQIKSGSNSFHGSAYWYNENNALKAKPYFQPAGSGKPRFVDTPEESVMTSATASISWRPAPIHRSSIPSVGAGLTV